MVEKKTPQRKPKVASVVPLNPPMMDTVGCAVYRGVSPSYVIQERQADSARRELGYEPVGPRWHRIDSQIVYFKGDVDAWLKAHAEPYGKTTRGRKPLPEAIGAEPSP